jgi:hypothetical protein
MIPHHVIIIPGLGNKVAKHEWAVRRWRKFGITPHIFNAQWTVEEPNFDSKLQRALTLVDSLSKPNTSISLIGNSAGSSFALTIFGKRKQNISSVVINCGRIRSGDWPWFTFDQATALSPSFRESVLMAEKTERTLTDLDRSKILTLRPLFDETVPPFTVPINGAKNEVVPSVEHVLSIALNMTLFSKKIIDFIKA